MSHTAYFQKLVGKTVASAHHDDADAIETVTFTFTDGTVLKVWSWYQTSLDSSIEEPKERTHAADH